MRAAGRVCRYQGKLVVSSLSVLLARCGGTYPAGVAGAAYDVVPAGALTTDDVAAAAG